MNKQSKAFYSNSNFTMSKYQYKFKFLFVIILLGCYNRLICQSSTIILGRPTDSSITASILFDQKVEFFIEYGLSSGLLNQQTRPLENILKTPDEVELNNLLPNSRYYYRIHYKAIGSQKFILSPLYTFHTQRSVGSRFKFLLEADEHLYDKKGSRSMYKTTLQNQANDSADFLISLGDIFGDDHTPDQTTSQDMDDLHRDYLQYLGAVCHSMPFYVCLGNHEGETGYYLKQNPPNNIAVYGTQWRKFYYPNPYPNDFYSGNTTVEPYGINNPENYYAWTWGDALFVVLDVYRDCDINEKPQNWDWTLGESQYKWLKQTLETSTSKFKFVFAHHTRGQGRGGILTAKGCEWGGYSGNSGTNYQFDTYRPGWGLPIHQLMVKNGVNIFFQGHDHLYAKEELDGLVYQEVPMPSDSTYEIGMLANAEAYTDVTLGGTGHLRVEVSSDCITVDFVRAYLPKDTLDGRHHNGEVAYSFHVGNCTSFNENNLIHENTVKLFPNPANDLLFVDLKFAETRSTIELCNIQGQPLSTVLVQANKEINKIDVSHLPSGIYLAKIYSKERLSIKKFLVIH